jgi:hypothetical protein
MSIDHFLMATQAVAAAIAATRLLRLGQAGAQSGVFVYLSLCAAGNLALSAFPLQSGSYFWAYLALQAAVDITSIVVVRQLFSTAVEPYPGIQTAGRWTMYVAISLALMVSVGFTLASWRDGENTHRNLSYVLHAHQALQFALGLVIVSMFIFLSRYPLDLHRNTHVSGYFFGGIFLIEAASTLIATLSPRLFLKPVDDAVTVMVAISFFAWAALMQKQSTAPKTIVVRTAHDVQLINELEALNRTLSRVGRR